MSAIEQSAAAEAVQNERDWGTDIFRELGQHPSGFQFSAFFIDRADPNIAEPIPVLAAADAQGRQFIAYLLRRKVQPGNLMFEALPDSPRKNAQRSPDVDQCYDRTASIDAVRIGIRANKQFGG
jgi:hypothetical protein